MTMQLLEDKANANKTVTKFVLPIGIINLNGTAFFLGFSIIFLAHRCGIYFTGSDIISLGLGCTLLSMSGASIPSASLVLLITLCNTVGVPSENVGILIAVDWFLDRVRTINNLLGDCFTVAVVQHMSRKQLAEKVVVEKVCKKIPNNKSGENRVQSDGSQTNKAYKQSPIMNQNHKQSPLMNHANNNNNKQSPILNHTYKQSPVMNHKLSPMITRTEMVCWSSEAVVWNWCIPRIVCVSSVSRPFTTVSGKLLPSKNCDAFTRLHFLRMNDIYIYLPMDDNRHWGFFSFIKFNN